MDVILQLFTYDLQNCSNEIERQRKALRQHELNMCLLRNSSNPYIKSIHIFVDTQNTKEFYSDIVEPYINKVIFVEHGRQPTYSDILLYITKTFDDGKTVCIMNSDMFFNSPNDNVLIEKIVRPNRLISLTRHEFTNENHTICNEDTCPFTVHGGSSDVFIFQTPVPKNFNYDFVNHKQNLFGAEGVFHKAWKNCGYEICNPCDSIITIHLHMGRIHFEKYGQVDTPENSLLNLKTKYPID
jgi:hypothetical protein